MGRTKTEWTVATLLLVASTALAGKPESKVLICHTPPGNPDAQRTIRVAESAVAAHLAHGDVLGECVGSSTKVEDETEINDPVDSDGDGVFDKDDWCPDTRKRVEVDISGCSCEQTDTCVSDDDAFTGTTGALRSMEHHNIILRPDGTIRTWGYNFYSQLGDGTVRNAVSVSVGSAATIVAKDDGTAWSFGRGPLTCEPTDTCVSVSSPVPVQVPLDDVVQVEVARYNAMALRGDGTVWGFGWYNYWCALGVVGMSAQTAYIGPLQIAGLPGNIVSISMGDFHTIAVDADGTAWTWGFLFGCEPRPVLEGVVAVAGGEGHSLFLKADGTVWAMGWNPFGMVGNGTRSDNYGTPTQVIGLTDVVAIAAGSMHSLFLKADGAVYACGYNGDGRLGLEDPATRTVPALVSGLTDVAAIAAGHFHSVFMKSDDTIWVSGSNAYSALDGGTKSTLPSKVFTPMQIELND